MLTVELQGFKELGAKLQELTEDLATKALKSGVSAAASVVRKRVLQNAKGTFTTRTGTLNRAIYQKSVKGASDGRWQQTYIVSVRQGKRYQKVGKRGVNMDAFYWWWLEFGTSKMPAHPFVRPALPTVQREAIEAMRGRLARQVKSKAAQLAARR